MQAAVFDRAREEALSEGVGKPRRREMSDRKLKPVSKLSTDERKKLRDLLAQMKERGRELGARNDKRFSSLTGIARMAGHENPSSLNNWWGPEPSEPGLFHFRRHLLPMDRDLYIGPKDGSVANPTMSSLSGGTMDDETKDLILMMGILPREARLSVVRIAAQAMKAYGIEMPSPQPPSPAPGSDRGSDEDDKDPKPK